MIDKSEEQKDESQGSESDEEKLILSAANKNAALLEIEGVDFTTIDCKDEEVKFVKEASHPINKKA